MNEFIDHSTFEMLIHLLELSVVIGIGVIIYITRKYSANVNRDMEKKLEDELRDITEE
ncbi:MAG TPA: hypothetical protein VKZ84_04395 [Bacteriovoracaceae bacterium]|nr:hypothetical protein [Bacteriovoracaceae bacterium]